MLPVLILAGGLGTRLGKLTDTTPKVLVEVAGNPFIYHQLNLLKSKGITKVILALGYYGEKVKGFVENISDIDLNISFSFDGEQPLGTGGAILNSLDLLDDSFFVMYGDSYLDTDYSAIVNYFLDNKKMGLMTVLQNKNNWDKSNIQFSDGRIIKYDKDMYSEQMHYIDYGLGILNKTTFDGFEKGMKFDLSEIYKKLIKEDEMLAYEIKARFYETGSLKGIEETAEYIRNKIGNVE